MRGYLAICGSRSYGIETPESDYDIVATKNCMIGIPHSHIILLSGELFIKKFLLLTDDAYGMQISYPKEILEQSDLTDYILENRESIIRANLCRVYSAYMRKSDGLSIDLDIWYRNFPKRPAYSCMMYDTVFRYASKDISFEEAFHPNESFRQWLLAVRRKEIGKEEILKVHDDLQRKAVSVRDFYLGVQDTEVLNRTIHDMNGFLCTDVDML